ncbi:MAG: hypothetical protein C0482_16265 [Gordonia sp.]|nr:hypothetical protein [Gordonia sp. (in: high G+C Gram-positive bacteria)]
MRQHLSPNAARPLAALATAVALIMAIVGCTSTNEPSATGQDRPYEHYSAPPGLPAGDPATVLTTALAATFSWEPVTDDSPTDALRRAVPHLTGDALKSAQTPDVRGVRSSAEWTGWRASGDLITARVTDAQATISRPGTAFGRAVITQTVLHLNGGSTPYRTFTVTAHLRQVQGTWKLATYPDNAE